MTSIKETGFKLSLGNIITIVVVVIGFIGSYYTMKVTTNFEIDSLKKRVVKIEQINPDLLQYQLTSINEKIEELQEIQKKQNDIVQKVYDTLIK